MLATEYSVFSTKKLGWSSGAARLDIHGMARTYEPSTFEGEEEGLWARRGDDVSPRSRDAILMSPGRVSIPSLLWPILPGEGLAGLMPTLHELPC